MRGLEADIIGGFNKNGIVMTTFTGIGNKAATEQVLMSMHIGERYKPNKSFYQFANLKQLFEEITGKNISAHAAIIGEKIFYVESGVHVDGILKKPLNYEVFTPELVGVKRQIIIGKHSGNASVNYKIQQLGLTGNFKLHMILNRIKRLSIKKHREITDEEFLMIVKECEIDEKTD